MHKLSANTMNVHTPICQASFQENPFDFIHVLPAMVKWSLLTPSLSVYNLTFKMCGFHLESVIYLLSLPTEQIITIIFTDNKFLTHRKITSADLDEKDLHHFPVTDTIFLSKGSSWTMQRGCRLIISWLLGDEQRLKRNSVRLIQPKNCLLIKDKLAKSTNKVK